MTDKTVKESVWTDECTLKTEYWKIKYQNNDKRDIRDLNK